MPETTYDDICTFCYEVRGDETPNLFYDLGLAHTRDDYILQESEHFVVLPCIGALTEWYVLIVSKRHILSAAWLNDAERADLRSLIPEVSRNIGEHSGLDCILFEHGSYDFRDKGGACYDHAHIHLIATDRNPDAFLDHLPDSVHFRPCRDWLNAAQRLVTDQHRSYLALSTPAHDMIATANRAPSQFFRRGLATWMGADPGGWDWLTFPQRERVAHMIATIMR